MSDATGVAEAMLGLPGFRVFDVHESPTELVIETKTVACLVGCPRCGVVARPHERMLLGIRAGDRDQEVLGAWLAKESVRDVCLTDRPDDSERLLDKAIKGCAIDTVDEIRSLGRTLARWRTEILAHHTAGASNGPTEGSICS